MSAFQCYTLLGLLFIVQDYGGCNDLVNGEYHHLQAIEYHFLNPSFNLSIS